MAWPCSLALAARCHRSPMSGLDQQVHADALVRPPPCERVNRGGAACGERSVHMTRFTTVPVRSLCRSFFNAKTRHGQALIFASDCARGTHATCSNVLRSCLSLAPPRAWTSRSATPSCNAITAVARLRKLQKRRRRSSRQAAHVRLCHRREAGAAPVATILRCEHARRACSCVLRRRVAHMRGWGRARGWLQNVLGVQSGRRTRACGRSFSGGVASAA